MFKLFQKKTAEENPWLNIKDFEQKYTNPTFSQNRIIAQDVYLDMNRSKHKRNANIVMYGTQEQQQDVILSNLLQTNSSFVLPDCDGILHHKTFDLFEANGFRVHVLDCRKNSIPYNPLGQCSMTDVANITNIARVLMHNLEVMPQDATAARSLVYALLMYIATLPQEQHHLGTVIEYLRKPESELDTLLKQQEETIRIQYVKYKACLHHVTHQLLCDVVINHLEAMRFSEKNSLQFSDLCTGKHAVFVVHNEEQTFAPLYGIMLYQLGQSVCECASTLPEQRLAYPMTVVAPYGFLDAATMIASVAKYNMSVIIPQESMPKLKQQFGDDYELIHAMCDACILANCKELNTVEYISHELGNVPRGYKSATRQNASLRHLSSLCPLMTPEEILTMQDDECLVLIRAEKPIRTYMYTSAQHPIYLPPIPPEWKALRNKRFYENRLLSECIAVDMHGETNILAFGKEEHVRPCIASNILQCNSNYVVIDRGGELYDMTHHVLEKRGYQIQVFNCMHLAESAHYNPLDYIQDDNSITQIVEILTRPDTWWSAPERPDDTEAKALLWLLIRYVSTLPAKQRTFAYALELLRIYDTNAPTFDMIPEIFNVSSEIGKAHIECLNAVPADKVRSICIEACIHLTLFALPDVATMTADTEINLREIGQGKKALFLYMPVADSTFDFLANIMFYQLTEIFLQQACDNRVMMVSDSILPVFKKLLPISSKNNVELFVRYESMRNAKKMLEENPAKLFDMFNIKLHTGGYDWDTLEYLAEWLARTSIAKNAPAKRNKEHSASYSTYHLDRLNYLSDKECGVAIQGMDIAIDTKYFPQNHPNYKPSEQ